MSERLSTALWERDDRTFLEIGRLDRDGDRDLLSGVVVYRGRGGPTSVSYHIETDSRGHSRDVRVTLDEPAGVQTLTLTADETGRWIRDGAPLDLAFPCSDVDLAISPSTNTLAIRRLNLGVGESGTARVAWVQVPSFKVRAVEQTYERVDRGTYRFKGRFGSYRIDVDEHGIVLDYPGGGWRAVAHRGLKAATARRR